MKRSLLVSEYIASVPVRDGCSQSARTVYIRLILSIAPIIIINTTSPSGDHDELFKWYRTFSSRWASTFAVDLSRFGSLYIFGIFCRDKWSKVLQRAAEHKQGRIWTQSLERAQAICR
jgi:hypothetical protein